MPSNLMAVLLASVLSGLCASHVTTAHAGDSKTVDFVDTRTSQPLKIAPELFDTEQAKKFRATGENPYVGDQQAAAEGKKLYQLYSCSQCHGSQAQGQTAGGLTGQPNYRNAKSATDKGMFEIIWAGTNAGMGPKGKGLMDPTNPANGMTPDEVLKVIAWVRSMGGS
jgi:cytochrome c-L